MRVLVVPEQFPSAPGDVAGIFALDYVAAIARYCDVTVLLPGGSGRRGLARSERDGVEYLTWTPRLRGDDAVRRRLRHVETIVGLGRLDRALRHVDVVHAHGPVLYGVAGRTLARKLDVPVVVTVHTNPFAKLLRRAAMRRLTTRTLESADCVCPVSRELQTQIEAAGIVPRRIEVTYNPVDTDLFRPGGGGHRRILFAGRLEEYKGALRTLRAFAAVAERLQGWNLTIAGDGPERPALEAFLRERPSLAARVELTGAYTKPQLAELLARSDCFVCPSRHESFGIVLAEAMAAGVPVIAPDRTAPPEFVDERCGLLVDPDDEEALARALEQLATTLPNYRPDVIRAVVVERFGLTAFGARLSALYEDLRGGRACAESQA